MVAVALLRPGPVGSEVLAAQRAHPVELAGQWELPGGKLVGSEGEVAAAVRECREELSVQILVGERLGRPRRIRTASGAGALLIARTGRIVRGEPKPLVHRALRWVGAGELPDLAWLSTNTRLVVELRSLLEAGAS